ncbi:metallopeptidase family protein [Haliangium ochraceum]|uniref:Tetratricopeptide repeat protein n=1 Tax=Haliangium ochraceum (strain DSM 14365 / JCM 11303 / SMP-2) TaxID=502025 RepID=D0LZA2_HALO1|nr:metallopeptidase family protein [Haliangium ochraceum]ACY16364.1 protein of unknown function DUF1025 [Haliangium ochraceum DSM 14365]
MDKQLTDDIARGWTHLEDEDLDGARSAYQGARERMASVSWPPPGEDGDSDAVLADLSALGGALAERAGDGEAALQAFREAHERAPQESRYFLWAADVTLGLLDDPAGAAALCDRALDVAVEDDDLVHAVVLKAEALIGMGHEEAPDDDDDDDDDDDGGDDDDDSSSDLDAEARRLLSELASCAIDEPQVWCRAGDIYLALGDLDEAESAYKAAIAVDGDFADAFHGLGTVYAEREDFGRMVEAWLEVRRSDLASPPPLIHMDADGFQRVAEAAFAELPEEARRHLANVPILIDDAPSEELVREGIDPRLLGLFSGVPLPEKSTAAGQIPSLDGIYLFQRNLERTCHSMEHLEDEIRTTLLHETAHFFGLEDDDLELIGLG